jgi:monoamine oxidase
MFRDDQTCEHGGELIDTDHDAIRKLAGELDLNTKDLLEAERPGTEDFFYFNGGRYTFAQLTKDIHDVWPTWRADTEAAGPSTTYNSFTDRGRQLDYTPLSDYLHHTIPGGRSSKLARLLDVAYNIEYGAETNLQSTLNFLYLIGLEKQNPVALFGASDERFRIEGGNDQIPQRLARKLEGRITLGCELTAIRLRAHGKYELTFKQDRSTKTVVADKVVMAIPFSVLRSSVDISQAGFKALKRTAIAELGMGTNSKLHLQFTQRHWEMLGCNGATFADTGYQNSWDATRAQPGQSGILVNFTGGNIAARLGAGTPEEQARKFLRQLEPVLPGITDRWNGRTVVDCWADHPWSLGSYSYRQVGQYTKFAGVEAETENNCFFAGEHTSVEYGGYLNGAVVSGQTAARDLLAGL